MSLYGGCEFSSYHTSKGELFMRGWIFEGWSPEVAKALSSCKENNELTIKLRYCN